MAILERCAVRHAATNSAVKCLEHKLESLTVKMTQDPINASIYNEIQYTIMCVINIRVYIYTYNNRLVINSLIRGKVLQCKYIKSITQ